jgi:Zn-dependent M28 family amino/carboxypeptidase
VELSLSEDLRAAVAPEDIREHLVELDHIARSNAGIRAAGTSGYDQTVDYVADLLRDAGYEVTLDEFTIPFFSETAPTELAISGGPIFTGTDHLRALIFSASGDISAPVVTVALDEEGDTTGSAGCAAADWDDFPAGAIALSGPGGCYTRQKVDRAITAGAAALVVFNPNWPTGEVRRPTLLYPAGVDIPAIGASAEVGQALREAAARGASAHLSVQTLIEDRVTANVIAERAGIGPGPAGDEVVMVGGHLDSVIDGPGINDNGSGTMTILEIARELAELEPTARTVRFAFWSTEELGLYGSRHWVDSQSRDELDRIVAYLNFDMVASSNYVRQVYDSSSAAAGSGDITAAFGAYFDAVGLTWQAEDLGGGSDHAPFDDALIPTGGLFSGASERKTDEQAELFGGSANEPNDRCYHLACDDIDRINDRALDEMSDAAAHVLMLLLLGG